MPTIEVEVGTLHENLDEQLREALGEQYTENLRNNTEDFIHDTFRQVERAQEQQVAGGEIPVAEEVEEDEEAQ